MQNLKLREERQLADPEQAVTSPDSTEAKGLAEEAKARAMAKVAELQAQLAAAEAELQPKRNAVVAARAEAAAAEAARVAAVEAAGNAEHALEPVSVFISRDTQRLYVRQAFQPILDIPVTIRDSETPIGTHVFTAVERADKRGMQWSVVSLVGSSNIGTAETYGPTHKGPEGHAEEMDLFNAKAALDRIVIPEDTVDRIREMVSPRSSLIISDEGPSSETGRGTEFVIIMSGEPQGGFTNRRHRPEIGVRYEPRGDRYFALTTLLRFLFYLVTALPTAALCSKWRCRTNGSPSYGPRSIRSKPERTHPFAQHARNGLGSRCRSPNWRPSAVVVRLAGNFLGIRRVWASVLAGSFHVTGNVGNISSKRSASSRYGVRIF